MDLKTCIDVTNIFKICLLEVRKLSGLNVARIADVLKISRCPFSEGKIVLTNLRPFQT